MKKLTILHYQQWFANLSCGPAQTVNTLALPDLLGHGLIPQGLIRSGTEKGE